MTGELTDIRDSTTDSLATTDLTTGVGILPATETTVGGGILPRQTDLKLEHATAVEL